MCSLWTLLIQNMNTLAKNEVNKLNHHSEHANKSYHKYKMTKCPIHVVCVGFSPDMSSLSSDLDTKKPIDCC